MKLACGVRNAVDPGGKGKVMANPWRWWDAGTIARVTGSSSGSVTSNWPLIADALERRGIYERDVCLGVIPTIAIETASTFEPIDEFTDWQRWPHSGGYPDHYVGGPAFHGRGFMQLTHRGNYQAAGTVVGVDLVADPDRAKDPSVAAEIVAWWFATKGVPAKDGSRFYTLVDLCREHDWEWVRRAVQGGTDGLGRLVAMTSVLDVYKEPAMPDRVTFNPQEPPHRQEDDFDCSQEAYEWGLYSLGRTPEENWLEPTMIAEKVMSRELGLLDATGAGLAAFHGRHYGDDGHYANNESVVTWDALVAEVSPQPPYPVLIGGRSWGGPNKGHWSGLAGHDPQRGVLLLKNPATGPTFGHETLNREQFEARGPWSMVRLLHPDLLTDVSVPPPPPPPAGITKADLDPVVAKAEALMSSVADLVHASKAVRDRAKD